MIKTATELVDVCILSFLSIEAYFFPGMIFMWLQYSSGSHNKFDI